LHQTQETGKFQVEFFCDKSYNTYGWWFYQIETHPPPSSGSNAIVWRPLAQSLNPLSLPIPPLHVHSLKEACISRLEELILSGELKAGQRLPSERDLALQLNISRPVLHEALVDLAAKGLVSIRPRRGVVVNDYRKTGSCAILSSLLTYNHGQLDPRFVSSLFGMRLLIEVETARLAAVHASDEQIQQLRALLEAESRLSRSDTAALTRVDFEFHLLVSIASGSLVYPLIINSFKNVYTHFTGLFFQNLSQGDVLDETLAFQHRLVDAIAARSPLEAGTIMSAMLMHGEQQLKGALGWMP
jgi:DNA-binding FadR family transcriptional regulator